MTRTSDSRREPKYLAVKQHLTAIIDAASPGDNLPTERALTAELATSRATVRQAIAELVGEGRLNRRQGAGTFVARPKLTLPLQLAGFTDQLAAHGHTATTNIIAVERVKDAGLAGALGVPAGQWLVVVERLRKADGVPIAFETSVLPAARFPYLRRRIKDDVSLYRLLGEEYGVEFDTAIENISTVPAPHRLATLFEAEAGIPLLVIGRHSRDTTHEPVEFATCYYRGDRVNFQATINRENG